MELNEPAVNSKHRSVDKVYGEVQHDLRLGGHFHNVKKFMGEGRALLNSSVELGSRFDNSVSFPKMPPPPTPTIDLPRTGNKRPALKRMRSVARLYTGYRTSKRSTLGIWSCKC